MFTNSLLIQYSKKIIALFICGANHYLDPVVTLLVRVWVFQIFFFAGLTKLDSWENTLFLFEFEYAVPILPVALAAFLAILFEVGGSILVLLGLATRFISIPLLGMSMVIQFVLGAASPAYDNIQHYYWMILLLMLIARGGGKMSIDHLLSKSFKD